MAIEKEKYSFWHMPATIKKMVHLMRIGSVVLSTTDTVLGLLAPVSQAGRAHLDTIKKRQEKPYIVLLPSADLLDQLVDPIDNLHIEKLIRSCWPGPLTLIFKACESVPPFVIGAAGTIAIRVPNHAGLQAVLAHCGPLFSTSANVAYQPVPQRIAQVDADILDAVAYIVDDEFTASAKPVASTILDCSQNGIRVVREGAYPLDTLQKIAGVQFS